MKKLFVALTFLALFPVAAAAGPFNPTGEWKPYFGVVLGSQH